MAGLCSFGGAVFTTLTMTYSLYSGVNQGVISTLFVLSSIIIAIMSYFILGEKMNMSHYGGMLLMIMCAIVLSFANTDEVAIGIDPKNKISPVWPVLTTLLSTILYAFRGFLAKYYSS